MDRRKFLMATALAATATSDAKRKADVRRQERDIQIHAPKNPARRIACLADIYKFLPTYFPAVFYQPFTADRREMIDAILHAARYGGDQAVAGPRADGKTRSALFGALFLELGGHVDFAMIISKSGPRASRELKNLKQAIDEAVSTDAPFAQDFPEICEPIRRLERWASKARQQTAFGKYTEMEWGEECIILPTIPSEVLWENVKDWPKGMKSAARGQITASLGIEGPIRGYSVRNRRPEIAILDDIDDRESASSELQTETRERIIEEDIGGLAGPDRTIARVMCCTLLNRTCIAARYTDRTQKPSWRGQRHKLLLKMPTHVDDWEEYMQLRKNRAEDDPDARAAHRFLLERYERMHEGAEVTNPYRFDGRLLIDGEPAEVSALQACFNLIADRNWDHFNTEYQNDPPEELGPVESGITPHRIQRQLSGYPRKEIPPGCVKLVRGIDCRKVALHWVVRAFAADGTGYTIDYGVHEVLGTKYGSDEGVDVALKRAILDYLERSKSAYGRAIDRTLIDAGWQTSAVYSACAEAGLGVQPVMGYGKSSGCVQANFHDIFKRSIDRKPGDGWFLSRKGKVWLVNADADRWKTWEHDRWMTAPGRPGCMYIFGETNPNPERLSADEKEHHSYARHICNEIEIEEPYKDTIRRRWKAKSDNTHWLDASYYADVAANMEGVRIIETTAKPIANAPTIAGQKPVAAEPPMSLQQLRSAARRAN